MRCVFFWKQHVDGTGELGHVDHPERAARVPDPNFLYAPADRRDGLPVIRLPAALYQVKLMAGLSSGRGGEAALRRLERPRRR